MAAVAVPPSPQVADVMASRRVPLANLQNATNSPMRAAAIGGKRQRSHASEQRDLSYGQPPAKKLMVETDDADARRSGLVRRSAAPPTALTKKLEAAREHKVEQKVAPRAARPNTRGPEVTASNLETIRNWQRHYRKLFPQFVFWFESVPEDIKSKISRQAQILGSREAKFFSREVTHVITARALGPEFDSSSSSTAAKGTVNPAQLESKKSVFDNALETQRTGGGDILHKAKDLGMKIWALDKLQRMLDTMFNTATGEDVTQYRNVVLAQQPTARRDLQKLLEQEKLTRPTDRDYTVAAQDMIPLRGFYIYIHDMDELTRPVMVREYTKVPKKEDGKWPQFRVSGNYKCPFIEDREAVRRQQMEEQDARHARRMANAAPRTRAVTAALDEKRALAENPNLACRNTIPAVPGKEDNTESTGAPKALQTTRDGVPPMFGSAQASLRAMPRFIGGEPVASGLHQSNITSAIKSQMISSTAAAPGARAGNSKEVNQLKRKVLERNSGPSVNSANSSTVGDASLRAALNQEHSQPTRAAKRKAQESLEHVREDTDEERKLRKAVAMRRKKPVEKELKPGYCENCREKFNDFDEHVVSRKHRKFAVTTDNWMELDQLLAQLIRE
ncbi:hypothetical protein DPSP01_011704 [Paraphaeosphaeria sporulosa]